MTVAILRERLRLPLIVLVFLLGGALAIKGAYVDSAWRMCLGGFLMGWNLLSLFRILSEKS